MPKMNLSDMTLNLLADGLTGRMIDSGLETIMKDVEERGHDKKTRTLNVKITVKPEGNGLVSIDAEVEPKLPKMKTPPTQAKIVADARGRMKAMFNPEVADNVDQQTFSDLKTGEDKE